MKKKTTKAKTKAKTKAETKPKVKRKRKSKKKNSMYYVDPKEFQAQIQVYYDTDVISEELGTALYNMATHLGYRPNFINYTYREDMIGDAIVKMLQALQNKNFDTTRGYSAFSYFNQIAWWAFVNRIKKENKEHDMVATYREEVYNNYVDIGYIPDDNHEAQEHHEFEGTS